MRAWVVVMLVACLACLASPASAAPGELDPGFGRGGIVRVDVDPAAGNAKDSVAVDAQGRIVVLATSAKRSSTLLRFEPSGAIDPAFGGGDGSAPVPGGPWRDIAIEPDGRIVLAGSANGGFAVARFDADGALDPTFGAEGIAGFHFDPTGPPIGSEEAVGEVLVGVAVQSDGGIVAAGSVRYCDSTPECYLGGSVVVRYRSDGTLDPGFGNAGIAVPTTSRIDALALQPDGKILLGGTNGNMVVLRLDASGSLDPSFSKNGIVVSRDDTEVEEEVGTYGDARELVVQPGGRVVAVGEMILLGLRPDGSPDPSFGSEGSAHLFGGPFETPLRAEAALADPKGRILVAGRGSGRTVVSRFFRGGGHDPRFAGDGLARVNLSKAYVDRGTPAEGATGIAMLADGSILTAGVAFTAKHGKLALVDFRGGDGHLARCHGRPAVLQGTPGDDRLFAVGPIVAFGGDDEIAGYGRVCAGAGDDSIRSAGRRSVYAGSGDDLIVWRGPGRILAGPGDDVMHPARREEGGDVLRGGPGADFLAGGMGRDRLFGGPGRDRLSGGGGRDFLQGGSGNDFLTGGPGTDLLRGGPGANVELPGPDGAPVAIYQSARAGFRIRLTVRNRRITGLHLTARLHCGKGRDKTSSWSTNHSDLRIDAGGRFHYSSSERDLEENEYGEYLAGRVRPRSIVGAFREFSEIDGVRCSTGRPKHRVLHFRARRILGPHSSPTSAAFTSGGAQRSST